ncbi:MAG: hypothetical protein ACRDKV_04730, partial [Solirubrobacterales bacterium]
MTVASTADGSALSPIEKARLAAEIVATYPRVRWLLWRHDLPATVAALRRHPDGENPHTDQTPGN